MLRRAARLLATLLVVVVVLPAALYLLATESGPRVAPRSPADHVAAAGARDLLIEAQALSGQNGERSVIALSETVLNGALASAARVLPGLAARTEVTPGALHLAVSLPDPMTGTGRWLNAAATLVPAPEGVSVASASLGRLSLPADLVLPAVRFGLDRMLGDGLGTAALAAITELRLDPPEVAIELTLDEPTRRALADRARTLTATGRADERERVYVHLWWLNRRVEEGELPAEGSVLAYLHHAVERAGALGEGGDAAELRAALYALALYCGDARFGAVIGVGLNERMRGSRNACAGTTLGGRRDLRQHFILSAAIKAASSAAAASGIGELKELLDSGEDGTGFSFDDMAANLAGARFAAVLLASPRADWPGRMASIEAEAAVMPAIDGLPVGLTSAEFAERFGDVESPAYRAMIERIEARIDALPFHRSGAIN